MTDRPARDARVGAQYGTGQRLNPGELEEIEAAARRGAMLAPNETLALVNTITALTRRIAIRFNETAEARHAVVKLSDRVLELETKLKDRERLPDLGQLANAIRRADQAEQSLAELDQHVVVKLSDRVRELETQLKERGELADLGHLANAIRRAEKAERALRVWEQGEWLEAGAVRQNLAALEQRISELVRRGQEATQAHEQTRQSLKDARVQIADLRAQLNARYTRDQVAQLQTSEAELVSTPLKARIEELEKELRGRDVTIRRLQERIGDLTEVEAQLHQANLALEQAHRQQAVDANHSRQLQAQVDSLNVAVNDWMEAGKKIAGAVFSEAADKALETETVEGWSARASQLGQVVRAARAAMPAYRDTDPPAGSVHA